MKRYNPKVIEPKWQAVWEKSKIYQATEDKTKPKRYVLEYFPYPSGAAMHVGHVRNYTIGDAIARYNRMQGNNVLYPMGWDAFGLPAENYAIKTGISPQEAVARNVENFKQQLMQMGFSYDWSREINSTDPSYYKWTQWFFLLLYKKGLAYQEESLQWWCPFDKTVLANEQVEDGRCWRCGNLVEKKALKQWFFRIIDYADRLADDLDNVNWSEAIKAMQRNWIGRSQGAEINFAVESDLKDLDFVFLHGFKGTNSNDFWPWLKKSLQEKGAKVYAPNLPHTTEPIIEDQVNFLLKNHKFSEKTVLVTHSLGGVGAMKLLPKLKRPINSLIMIAPPLRTEFLDGKKREPLIKACDWEFDFEAIKKHAKNITVLADIEDDVVPISQPQEIAENLSADFVSLIAQKPHFNSDIEPTVLGQIIPKIKVFTTRPDTIYGATFLVLAPEHKILNKLSISKDVKDYIEQAERKSEIDRMETEREKTGVFTGAHAINPANNEKVPIWVADYVLPGYGTGAIMAVPAHDERDWQFAKKFKLPIIPVIMPQLDFCISYIMGQKNISESDIKKFDGEVVGKTDAGYLKVKFPKIAQESYEKLIEEKIEAGFWNEYIGDEVVFIFKHKNGKLERLVLNSKNESHIRKLGHAFNDQEDSEESVWGWLGANSFYGEFFLNNDEGKMINSGPYNNSPTAEAREKMTKDFGRERVNYKIRDWLISRQRYWGAPIPIIHCQKCGVVPVPEDQLPVQLPELKKFEPAGDGRGPLANVPEFVNVKCPKCGGQAERETDTMDGFACSSWYFLRFADPHNDQKAFARAKVDFWLPVDDYIGGAEHAVMHLLYARFWTKVMFDEKLIDFDEPFKTLRNQGMILAPDGRKMSKSWNNTIEPDQLIKQGYGADSIRLLELFIGPWNQAASWSVEGLGGTFRFLQRVWTLVGEFLDAKDEAKGHNTELEVQITRLSHKAIKKVSQDMAELGFNTAIATLMETVNELYKIKSEHNFSLAKSAWRDALIVLTQLLAPFAPHIAEELWSELGQSGSVHISKWPAWDETLVKEDLITLAVQVNGKVRAEILVEADIDEKAAIEAAKNDDKVAKLLAGKKIKKAIYVPGRLVSLVI